MKRILFALCTSFLIGTGALSQTPEGGPRSPQRKRSSPLTWVKYTVKGEEFAVALPTVPAMTTSKVFDPGIRKNRLHRRLQTSDQDGVLYTIDIFENAGRQSLEEFIATQQTNSGYELTNEWNLNIDGFSGKEYSFKDKTSSGVVQFWTTTKRLYRFAASASEAQNDGVKQFFATISLGKKADGIAVTDGPGIPLPPSIIAGEDIFTGKEVDVKIRILAKPEPSYTVEARNHRVTGTVILKAVFGKTGQVENISVISGLPYGLTERAIAAARMIRFTPAMKDGMPVSMWMQLEYNFNL
ncbi:MAG TPA: energy transducer TonB [Pyrinomonadaceae bacterium]